MILTPHLLVGAAIASKINFFPLALILAFLSHYLLDLLPHSEYSLKNIKIRNWLNSFREFILVGLDISTGLFLIFIFSENKTAIYYGALMATLPDFLVFLGLIFQNKFLAHNDDLHKKIHFLKNKKISGFGKFSIQISIILLAIFFLR